MKHHTKHTAIHYMRSLHRDIGFILIGLTVIYSVSGFLLIFRDTDFLKSEKVIEKQIQPNTEISELAMMLHARDFKVIKTEGDSIFFKNGTYNNATGDVKYTTKESPFIVIQFAKLHMASSNEFVHWFTTIYSILLLFLAISSFWMFQTKSKLFRRGIYFAIAGVVITVVLLILS